MTALTFQRYDFDWRAFVLWLLLGFAVVAALSGCSASRYEPPKTVEVVVPVPVECQIEQVPTAEKPKVTADMGIFEMARTLLAERQIAQGETARLRAANTNPCPGE